MVDGILLYSERRPKMCNKNQISPAHQELLEFFSMGETPTIQQQLKEVFRVAAFESEISEKEGGKDSLFTLWYIIELLEKLKEENSKQND